MNTGATVRFSWYQIDCGRADGGFYIVCRCSITGAGRRALRQGNVTTYSYTTPDGRRFDTERELADAIGKARV